jgi:hypothetical protein
MAKTLKKADELPKYMIGLNNIRLATKVQYEWLYTHCCSHRHRYTKHFNCFLKDYKMKERKGFIDLETSNLKANFGIILCWCIGTDDGEIYEDWMTKEDVLAGIEDKRVIESCIECIQGFDRLIGHYSSRFDIPFLRTRALIQGVDFPPQGSLLHTDVWKMAKSVLCLHSNRQAVISESLYGKTAKTRINNAAWRKAMLGDAKSMDVVVDHCRKDIYDLRRNYGTLLPFVKETRSYI